MAIQLTEKAIRSAIERAKITNAQIEIADMGLRGLRLRVTAAGKATWILGCRDREGKARRFGLGTFPTQGISAARDAAREMRVKVQHGGDPIAERRAVVKEAKARAARDHLTVEALVQHWADKHLAKRSERYRAEAQRALKFALAEHWTKPAEDLDRAAVRRVLDGMDRRRSKVGNTTDRSAIQVRTVAYGKACWAFAVAREMVPTNPFINLPLPETAPARDRVLSDAELVDVLKAADAMGGTFGRIVRLLFLTGVRREEAAGATWGEFSADMTTWRIPAARMKAGRDHVVHLSAAAREGLAGLERGKGKDLVFASGANTPFCAWSKSKRALDASIAAMRQEAAAARGEKAEAMEPWRLHDLRRTLATAMQKAGVNITVTEAILGHASGTRSGIVSVYQTFDYEPQRKAALESWGHRVTALVAGESDDDASNVVQLRA